MAIQDRIEDAVLLWHEGRRESALLLACVAVAARARLEFPEETDGFVAFEQQLRQGLSPRIRVEFRGELHSVEKLLYVWVRCELVHNAAIPLDLVIDDDLGEGLVVRAGGAPDYLLRFSPGWFGFLTAVAAQKAA